VWVNESGEEKMSKNLSNDTNDFINLVDGLIIDLVDDLPDNYNDDLDEETSSKLDEELNDELKPCPFCGYRAYIDYCNYNIVMLSLVVIAVLILVGL
jgi:hypothetical protein